MRGWVKIILPLVVTASSAAFLVTPGHAQLPPCPPGTVNPLYCEVPAPTVHVQALRATCHRNSPVHVNATITAQGGLTRVRITLDGKTIKTQKSGKVRITIKTKGLKVGVHKVKIVATDKSGKHTTRTLTFRVCKPRPLAQFTG